MIATTTATYANTCPDQASCNEEASASTSTSTSTPTSTPAPTPTSKAMPAHTCNSANCDCDNQCGCDVKQKSSKSQTEDCALAEKCVQACAAYGRICPCTARAAGRAAHDKIKAILTDSNVFQCKPDLHTINEDDVTIGRKLGEGGFAVVHTCTIKGDGTEDQYAVKYLKRKIKMDVKTFKHGAADLATEAFFLGSIDHPNFIRLKGITAGSVENNVAQAKECGFFIVIDRLNGTLEERINKLRKEAENDHKGIFGRMSSSYKEKQRFKLMERLLYAIDIANAMDHLHSMNLIFRDLKPDNVGFDSAGILKLFDLGLCTELKQSRKAKGEEDKYEMTGHTGSKRYMAPEVAKGETYNNKVDVYSFGILLWELCALEKPFQGYSGRKHMQHVVLGGERPKMDHSHVANWPIDLQWLIKSCWADSPDQRPSFETIKKSLEDIVNETTTSPVSPKRSNRSQTVGTKFSAASPDKFQHRAPLTPQPQSKSGGKAKIAPPVGGFGSIKKPDKSGGRSWSLGFRRGGSPKIV